MTGKSTAVATVLCLAAILASVSSTANANTMSYQGMPLSEITTLHAPGHLADNLTVYTGLSHIIYEGQDFDGYCVDIDHYAGTGEATVTSIFDLHNGDKVAYLFDTYAPHVQTSLQAGALELAIWEVINETGDFSLTTGSFWASSNNPDLIPAADALLANLPSEYHGNTGTFVINGRDVQDFVVTGFIGVPEPTTLALIAFGLPLAMRRMARKSAQAR
jgi:hypothetical protein